MHEFGFVILAPDHNIGRVKSTLSSIISAKHIGNVICIVGEDTKEEDVLSISKLCPCYKGRKTITSLINTGMRNGYNGWNMIIMEGTLATEGSIKKLLKFIDTEKDVIFPIIIDHQRGDGPARCYMEFQDSTLNGMTIHKNTFLKIGDFSDNPLDISRFFWSAEANEQGCIFKGVLGAKMI